MKRTLAMLAVAGLASAASAQYNVNLGNLFVTDAGLSVDLNGAGIPAANYTSYSVSVDWVAGAGGPWSVEAIWGLTDQAFFPGNDPATVFYADPGSAPNAAFDGNPVTLTWTGFLSPSYNGGDALWFNALQTFGGSDAQWNNVDITLGFDTVMPPMSIDLGVNPDTMTMQPIAAGEIQWYSFDLTDNNGALPWSMSTFGSTNPGGTFGPNDTEMALYDSDGNLLFTNDDEDFGNGILTSLITDGDVGALADGTYYIAVGNFNSSFADAFGATSTSDLEGTTKLTVSFAPAPGSLALLGLGGLAATRRRRA